MTTRPAMGIGRRCSPGGGFTLLELLIVMAIIVLAAGALGVCLGAGIRVWETSRRYGEVESEAVMALEIMQRDLMNTFAFHGIEFQGKPDGMVCCGLIPGEAGLAGPGEGLEDASRRIGSIAYSFDAARKVLARGRRRFPEDPAVTTLNEQLLRGVQNVQFEYLVRPAGKAGEALSASAGQWYGEWRNATNLPDAVRVELLVGRDAAAVEMSRTLVLLRRQ